MTERTVTGHRRFRVEMRRQSVAPWEDIGGCESLTNALDFLIQEEELTIRAMLEPRSSYVRHLPDPSELSFRICDEETGEMFGGL